MIAILGLEERVGTDIVRVREATFLRRIGAYSAAARIDTQARRSPWVARITGLDAKHGFARTFLTGKRDYRDASSSGKTGVVVYFTMPEGFYEVREILSMSRESRYFVQSAAGKTTRVTRDEVVAWAQRTGAEVNAWLKSVLSGSAG